MIINAVDAMTSIYRVTFQTGHPSSTVALKPLIAATLLLAVTSPDDNDMLQQAIERLPTSRDFKGNFRL
jgi:hypothetical protein